MHVGHLNLAAADVEASRHFYEEFFGFDFGPNEFEGETLFLRDRNRFELALRPVAGEVVVGDVHVGFQLDDAGEVDELRWRLERHGCPIVERVEEEGFSLVRTVDPDGYQVEAYWDADLG